MRAWLGGVGVVMVIVMGAEVRGEELPFVGGKEPTGVTEPVNKDGTVDYLGVVNERYRVRAEENGYLEWVKVMGAREEDPRVKMAGGTALPEGTRVLWVYGGAEMARWLRDPQVERKESP